MKTPRIFAVIVVVAAAAQSHDLFLVMDDHDVPVSSPVTVALHNGTFDKSENTIDRDRMLDVTVVDSEGRATHPSTDHWWDEGPVTYLDFDSGAPGTCVVGVSIAPRLIELTADEFNEYLEHDGVLDTLEARRRQGIADRGVVERYSKHVKTVIQVGGSHTDAYDHRFGYPVEIVPLANPAGLAAGHTLEVLVLADGKPLAGQLAYASYSGFHYHDGHGPHREAATVRTDNEGVARIDITRRGRWYVRLIHMVPVDEEGVDYESNWATLTFEVP